MSDLKTFIKDTISALKLSIKEIEETPASNDAERNFDDGQVHAYVQVISLLSHAVNNR